MNPPAPDDRTAISAEDQENLSAYLDGELAEEESEKLAARLGRSPDLRASATELKKLWELLDYLPRPNAPENFTEKTLHRLDTTKMLLLKRERRWRWLAVGGWAFTILLAAGFGFLFAFYWPREQPPVTTAAADNLEPTSEPVRDPNGRLQPPPFPKNMDDRVRRNVNRILIELRDKATLNEWHRLRESARHGTWEFLDELRSLAKKHEVPLDFPMPNKPKSPGEDTRPKPRNTARKGSTD